MRFLLYLTLAAVATAWTNQPQRMNRATEIDAAACDASDADDAQSSQTRRGFLKSTIVMAATVPFLVLPAQQAMAAGSDAGVLISKLSIEDAKKRFQLARKDVANLIDNFESITSKGGGDAIRNILGTQGINSNLFGIQKVLNILRDEADDLIEYSEAMDEFNAYYYQAEGAAYQSMFPAYSSSKSTPEELLAMSKKDLITMSKYMDQLAAQLKL